jgi:hypothetical protein
MYSFGSCPIFPSHQTYSYIYNCPIRCCNRSLNVETEYQYHISIHYDFRRSPKSNIEIRRLTSITNGLFVDYDIGSIGPWSRDSGSDSRSVRLQYDSIISISPPHQYVHFLKSQEAREDEAVEKSEEEKKGGKRRRKTHPSSTVSSAAKSTKSNPSKTFLLST